MKHVSHVLSGVRLAGVTVLTLLLAACHGGGAQSNSASTPSSAASAAPAGSAATEASPQSATPDGADSSAASSPTAEATQEATPPPNLLAYQNGTIVRAYTPGISDDPESFSETGVTEAKGADGQFLVYELPGVADLTGLQLQLDSRDESKAYSIAIEGSTTGPTSGFTAITMKQSGSSDQQDTTSIHAAARWLRVTLHGTHPHLSNIAVFGTIRPRPATAPAASSLMVATRDNLRYKNGAYNVGDESDDPWYVRLTAVGNTTTLAECNKDGYNDTLLGTMKGRTLTVDKHPDHRLVLNDEGTLLVGYSSGSRYYGVPKTSTRPKYCEPVVEGSGARKILVLSRAGLEQQYGLHADALLPNTQFTVINAAMATKDLLNAHQTVIFNMLCVADDNMAQSQLDLVKDYVHSGHVAIIWDSDTCGEKTDYSFLPYPFKTDNPGAGGAHGDRLIETESDALGSLDKSDTARFLDAASYAADSSNQLGDANTTVTKDEHWCGHLFGTNSHKINGFMQMYAPYGQGFFVYDGFDHDDSGIVPHQRIRLLEMTLSVPADLPCTTKVSQGFVVQPRRDATFTAGTAQTLHFDMELLANQGWKGHVTMSTSGSFNATVTPQQFDIAGGTQPLKIDVAIPASAKPGLYGITVQGSDGANTTSQNFIMLNGTAPLVKQILTQKRIRLYGIHFDYDSAHIQPRSEPVIKQVADLMQNDPKLRFQIEGHTDADGGAAYNLSLSQRRAQAVVDDLIHRYHIASSRLVAKGFGLTRPVAPNTTESGKALNRRVELLVL